MHRNQSRAPFPPSLLPPHPQEWNARAPRAATRCELSAPSSPFPSLPPIPRSTRTPSRLFTDARSSRSARSPANPRGRDRSIDPPNPPPSLPPSLSRQQHAIALPTSAGLGESDRRISVIIGCGGNEPDSDVPQTTRTTPHHHHHPRLHRHRTHARTRRFQHDARRRPPNAQRDADGVGGGPKGISVPNITTVPNIADLGAASRGIVPSGCLWCERALASRCRRASRRPSLPGPAAARFGDGYR